MYTHKLVCMYVHVHKYINEYVFMYNIELRFSILGQKYISFVYTKIIFNKKFKHLCNRKKRIQNIFIYFYGIRKTAYVQIST